MSESRDDEKPRLDPEFHHHHCPDCPLDVSVVDSSDLALDLLLNQTDDYEVGTLGRTQAPCIVLVFGFLVTEGKGSSG